VERCGSGGEGKVEVEAKVEGGTGEARRTNERTEAEEEVPVRGEDAVGDGEVHGLPVG